jgi:cytochrome c biogenesis protein CcmG/thiol:disulfide interchange protein DsbE
MSDPSQPSSEVPDAAPPKAIRFRLALIPLALFLALAGVFLAQLLSGRDPAQLPSALIGRPAPRRALPPVPGLTLLGQPVPGLAADALTQGHPTLVNIFASWCVPCRDEHALLLQLAADPALKALGLTIIGLPYKDQPEQIRRFLERGNPYAAIGYDPDGRAAIDWGAYGVPETFVINGQGVIILRRAGPIDSDILARQIMPAILEAAGI